jgi:hypothetical protein
MTSLRAYPYTATIGGIPHAIDEDDGRYVWAHRPPPTCPTCLASLGLWSDETERRVSVAGYSSADVRVHCDTCGHEWPIDHARPQP